MTLLAIFNALAWAGVVADAVRDLRHQRARTAETEARWAAHHQSWAGHE